MILVSAWCQISSVNKILPVIRARGFQSNNVNPLNAIKMYLKCHKLKFFSCFKFAYIDICNLEANSVDPDQQQFILCLHC